MSGGGGGRRGGRAPLAEINVTPLVDVMLVLLIIFMVAAPLLSTGVEVQLPRTRAPRMEQDEAKLVLSIDAERRIFLGEDEIPRERLDERLRTNVRLQEDDELYVRADESVPYGIVLSVFAAVQNAGVTKVGLVTDPAGGASDVAIPSDDEPN
ncbi:MAG: ExbD/TolR family protein [Myxococcota bacterium]